ncbi:MAG: VOC family protein, partial [Chloroflexota bacterium]|nr:VOC family protein [Chloroflexota bacterium]
MSCAASSASTDRDVGETAMILGIDHVGVAVRSAGGAGETFARLTGRLAGDVETVGGQDVRVCFVPGPSLSGEPESAAASPAARPPVGQPGSQRERGSCSAPFGADGARLELVEPGGEDSPVGRFLSRRGEGLHHVCFAVDDIGAEIERLGAAGFEMIDATPRRGHGGLVAFLH